MDVHLLSRLARTLGPPGFEDRVRAVIAEELAKMGYEAKTDAVGNLYVTLGSGRPLLVLAAHMDEVGFLVRHVEDSGFLRVVALGASAPRLRRATRWSRWARGGTFRGSWGRRPRT